MTQFLNKSFSVGMAGDQQYRDNWETIFGKKEKAQEEAPEPDGTAEPPEGNQNDCGACEVCDRMFGHLRPT